jgi:hypothetical protein
MSTDKRTATQGQSTLKNKSKQHNVDGLQREPDKLEDIMKTIKTLKQAIEAQTAKSAWAKAVKIYAYELIEEMDDNKEFYGSPADKKDLLNGAPDWNQYSWGGSSLIYNADIAERTCSPSELKKTNNGDRRPNANEEWLDVQARALFQASNMIMRLSK